MRLEVKEKKEMMELCSVQSTDIHWHLWVTKGCSSYCHPDFILLVLHSGFRFTERLQREIQLSMVGSCRTWNKDEPGLGRTKALPSSVPCRVAVILKVLSGRRVSVNVHLYTSYCTQWHGHAPPSQIHHTPTVQACAYTPLIAPPHPTPTPLLPPPQPPSYVCWLCLSLQPSSFFRATLKAGYVAECVVRLQVVRFLLLLCKHACVDVNLLSAPQSLDVHLCDMMTMHVKYPHTGTPHASVTPAHLCFLFRPALWPSILTQAFHQYGQYVSSCSWKENGSQHKTFES